MGQQDPVGPPSGKRNHSRLRLPGADDSEAQPTCHTGPRLSLRPSLWRQPEADQGL